MNQSNPNQPFDKMQYAKVSSQVRVARSNLFIVAAFTAINVLLASFGSPVYLLFSASVPYFFALLGAELCGLMPDEYYAEAGIPTDDFWPLPIFFILLAIALLIIGVYVLCGFLSKKYTSGFVVALVLFSIDTLAMFVLFGVENSFLDIIFHIWVIVYLVMGIIQSTKYKKLSKEAVAAAILEKEAIDNMPPEEKYTSPILREADMNVKFRVLAEVNAEGHNICYRHLKHVNELVIDGQVYADITFKLVESPHALSATIEGHKIVAGYDGVNSYITVDDYPVVSKVRII